MQPRNDAVRILKDRRVRTPEQLGRGIVEVIMHQNCIMGIDPEHQCDGQLWNKALCTRDFVELEELGRRSLKGDWRHLALLGRSLAGRRTECGRKKKDMKGRVGEGTNGRGRGREKEKERERERKKKERCRRKRERG